MDTTAIKEKANQLWKTISAKLTVCYCYMFCAKWSLIKRSPNQGHHFLFFGLRDSGKTAAIYNIFGNITKIHSSDQVSPTTAATITEIVSGDKKNSVIEVPGFGNKVCTQEYASILYSLVKYLHLKLSGIVPTTIFVTASLADFRFEEKNSDFSQALYSLYLLRFLLTDKNCSNVILLLTHEDRSDIQNDKKVRIDKYKEIFKKLFKVTPVCLVIGNYTLTADEVKERVTGDDNARNARINDFHSLFLNFLKAEIGKGAPWAVGYLMEKSLPDETPWRIDVPQKLLNCLNSVSTGHDTIFYTRPENFIIPNFPTKRSFETTFTSSVEHLSQFINAKEGKIYNLFRPTAQILLENRNYAPIYELTIGQKLFGVESPVGVVTNVVPIFKNKLDNTKVVKFGKIFLQANNTSSQNASGDEESFIKLGELNGEFHITYASDIGADGADLNNMILFYLEVNGGNSAFVANEYVCHSECDLSEAHVTSLEDAPTASHIF